MHEKPPTNRRKAWIEAKHEAEGGGVGYGRLEMARVAFSMIFSRNKFSDQIQNCVTAHFRS